MTKRFEDKVIMILGATSGLGKHAAVAFAAAGARVVAAGRRVPEGERTLADMKAAGGEGVFVPADIARGDDVRRVVETAQQRYGGLDLAYNVAGVSGEAFVKLADYTEEGWRQTIDINLTGIFLAMKYAIPAMLARGGGAIVNMASIAGLGGTPGGGGYVASKHGVVGLTKAAALDYADQNIRINAVAPGVIYTEMLEWGISQQPGLEQEQVALHPIGRLGQMQEVTNAVMWLLSDEAGFVTGATLPVDGGYLAK